MKTLIRYTFSALFALAIGGSSAFAAAPNFLFIFIDDSGWGDLSCYGNPVLDKAGNPITPNMDALAAAGTRFTQGYVASPICSPSRVGVLTGSVPCRHAINSFLDNKTANHNRGMNDWLQPDVVTSARHFRDRGWVTGNFGKWHMGGGRDVDNAPFPQDYGFQASLVQFEGMGDRVLYMNSGVKNHGLSNQNTDVPGAITWAEWEEGADLHTDAAISFITNAVSQGKPFFVHVPYDDTHTPFNTDPGKENDFDHISSDTQAKLFLSELNELDKEIGRLIAVVDGLGIANNTLIVLVGDNGPPTDNSATAIVNRAGGLRGGKGMLYEGGIREPFIIRMPGTVPSGVNTTTAVSTLDLLPTYCALAGVPVPVTTLDGEDMSDVFKGSGRPRKCDLLWEFGSNPAIPTSAPQLAIRRGNFKFLRDIDGSRREFYQLDSDPEEGSNVVANPAHTAVISEMESTLMAWYQEVVLGETGEVINRPSIGTGILLADTFDLPAGNSAANGFGAGSGVNEGLPGRLSGSLSGGMSYVQTNTGKAASAHSISNNALVVASAPNPTGFQHSDDGATARDFGRELAGNVYEWRFTLDLDDPNIGSARTSLSISSKSGATVDAVELGFQLDLVAGNTISVFKRIDTAAHAGGGDINTAVATGLPAGDPVRIRVVMDDSKDLAGFNTVYQVFVNDAPVDSGAITFANDSRFLIFDTAPNTGPARYDNFVLELTEERELQTTRIPSLHLSELAPVPLVGAPDHVRLYWTTQPGQVVRIEISSDLEDWEPFMDGGSPVEVATEFGTLRWTEVQIPAGYSEKAFVRLRVL